MKLTDHQPLLRQCAAVVAVLGLCAGGIAYLHARAAPERRQRSPAELALARRLPEIKLENASLAEVLRALSDGSVEFDTRALNEPFTHVCRDFWCPEGTTLEGALRRLSTTRFPRVHLRPEGRRLIVEPQATGPRLVRTFEVGSIIDSLCAEVLDSPELPWPMPSARQRFRHDVPRIAYSRIWNEMPNWEGQYTTDAALIGDHLVARNTWQALQLVQLQIDELRNAKAQIPPPAVLAALDAELPAKMPVELTLQEQLDRLLTQRVTYRVDWEALHRLGITPERKVWFDHASGSVATHLYVLLRAAEKGGNAIINTGVGENALTFGLDGDTLIIAPRDKLSLVRRTYSLDFLWTRPDGSPLTAQDKVVFDRAYSQTATRLNRFENVIVWRVRNRMIVIGDEYAQSVARSELERARREWKASPFSDTPTPKK